MKTIMTIFFLVLLILFNVSSLVFSAEKNADTELSSITKDIPGMWWDGGWDKLSELQNFILDHPKNQAQCARAQYYIGCYYYSKQEFQKAIDAYKVVISSYPSVKSDCSNAQFEIAQITLNSFNKPKDAIQEYKKVISSYPDTWPAGVSQLEIGRSYRKLQNNNQAKIELQKVVDKYPFAQKQQTEALIELGDIAVSSGAGKEAVSYYKKAYSLCPLDDLNTLTQIIDKICQGFKALDNSVARANQFIKYQKYGPAGEDKVMSTKDDLVNPLADF